MIHVAPGDPMSIMAGEWADYEAVMRIRALYRLDRPVAEQLLYYIRNIFQGELGNSFYGRPVMAQIFERLPATLLLMTSSLFIATTLGIILGITSAAKRGQAIDLSLTVITSSGYAMPRFWVAQILLIVFAVFLDLFPVMGIVTVRYTFTGMKHYIDILNHLILPLISVTLYQLALITRYTRTCMLEIIDENYIRTARSKGLTENKINYHHAFKNAALPVVTVIGNSVGHLFTGSVVTETVFCWPGIGRLMYTAIHCRDYPLIMGIFIFVSICIILTNLVTDIVYAFLDPRIRY